MEFKARRSNGSVDQRVGTFNVPFHSQHKVVRRDLLLLLHFDRVSRDSWFLSLPIRSGIIERSEGPLIIQCRSRQSECLPAVLVQKAGLVDPDATVCATTVFYRTVATLGVSEEDSHESA